jgi:hypothetical protein
MQTELNDLKDKSSKLSIPKLDEHNFLWWLSRMRVYLCSKHFWKYISGKKPTICDKKKAKASNVIISHLGDIAFNAVVTLRNEEDPKLLWETIIECFASGSINNKA